jgi:hypothetical protein
MPPGSQGTGQGKYGRAAQVKKVNPAHLLISFR